MTVKKDAKKLQLHTETLKRLGEEEGIGKGEGSEPSSPGCTVYTTCSPGCCNTVEN
jgi:hypothetical protein